MIGMLGEVRVFAGLKPPEGWVFCQGQMLQIAQNQALFEQIGANFGGDGNTTFALPDLRGRTPIHAGGVATQVGDKGGSETVIITADQLPGHTHTVGAAGAATTPKPQSGFWAENSGAATAPYAMGQAGSAMAAGAVTIAGPGQAHENMQPFLALNVMIAVEGAFITVPDAYLGEVRAFAGAIPTGWAACDGSLLSLRANLALAAVIGNTYGGSLKNETIGVPNLIDRLALGAGQGPGLSNRPLATTGGVDSVTLTPDQLAAHTHAAACFAGAGDALGPSGAYWAADKGGGRNYAASGSDRMAAAVFGTTGGTPAGTVAHENRQPFVAMNYAIALVGVLPTSS